MISGGLINCQMTGTKCNENEKGANLVKTIWGKNLTVEKLGNNKTRIVTCN